MAPRQRFIPEETPGADNDLSNVLKHLHGERVIRLAKLLRTKDYKLEIDIEQWQLDDKNLPGFKALSYTWGDRWTPDIASVYFDGKPYPITANLWEGLSHLRSSSEDRYFWIDQLCINQRDNKEKSLQIPLMQSIYQKASGVVAWLGTEEESTGDLLKYMGWVTGKPLKNQEKMDLGSPMDFNNTKEVARGIKALIQFLSRSWFSRIWVVQEATAQNNLALQVGKFKISFSALVATVERTNNILVNSNPSVSQIIGGRVTYFSFLRACPSIRSVGSPGVQTLKELVEKFCTWDSSEPRDKIYALLGLAIDISSYPTPDYSLSLRQINRDFASLWLKQSLVNALTTLTFAVAGGYPNYDSVSPSWVVDWSNFNQHNPISPLRNNYRFSAGGPLPISTPHYSFDGSTLTLPGIIIDKISAVSQPLHNFSLRNDSWLSSARQIIKEQHLTLEKRTPKKTSALQIDHDLGQLLILDGQSSLYALTGAENILSTHVFTNDLTDLNEHATVIAYSSHGHTFYGNAPGKEYYDLGVSPYVGQFDGPGLWPRLLSDEDNGTHDDSTEDEAARKSYKDALIAINAHHCVFRTDKGRLGVAKFGTEVGHEVVVFQGGRMPFVVRKGKGEKGDGYRVVSEAYVRGVMHGEAVGESNGEWSGVEVV